MSTTTSEKNSQEQDSGTGKVRLYKSQIRKLCSWYTDQVLLENPSLSNRLITPAFMLEVERALELIQKKRQKYEPQNTVWTIPVKPVYDRAHHTFEVDVADYNTILIVDFENPNSY